MNGISVIIPVKEPEPYLTQLTAEIYLMLKDQDHEILCQYEVGLTNAVIEGVKRSKFSHIVVMDADGSHCPAFIRLMFLQFHPYGVNVKFPLDLVIGSKLGRMSKDMSPLHRRIISYFFRSYARFMLGLKVSDPMSGFVMGRREIFQQLEPSNDYKFLLQLLCLNPPPKVIELPINFFPRRSGFSKATLRTGLRTLSLIHKLWRKRA